MLLKPGDSYDHGKLGLQGPVQWELVVLGTSWGRPNTVVGPGPIWAVFRTSFPYSPGDFPDRPMEDLKQRRDLAGMSSGLPVHESWGPPRLTCGGPKSLAGKSSA